MIKKCKNCGREFEAYDKPSNGRKRGRIKRKSNAKNCSRKCSNEWVIKKRNKK